MKKPAQTKPVDATVQARLDALESLIDAEYDGSAKVFQDKTGIKMAQVNQWFSGYRALRDKALKRLEEKTGRTFDRTRTHKSYAANPTKEDFLHIVSLEDALKILSEHLAPLDKTARRRAGALLSDLADDPESHESLGGILRAVLSSANSKAA